MPSHRDVKPEHRGYARRMRRMPTDAERILWHRVRADRLPGLRFRRQVPMLGFIADLVCHEARLIVELDDWQHIGLAANAARDRHRDTAFAKAGYLTLRIDNDDVIEDVDAVATRIAAIARERIAKNASGTPLPP
ncbi:endonuclease domain-containing protein [Fulvimarina sp. MAC8]|uniref:endonuclease domain-containing protein n=1 Tax=Fulvimarina sp. MAC8 TaxID=3162874 RepID=UPI0032EB7A48